MCSRSNTRRSGGGDKRGALASSAKTFRPPRDVLVATGISIQEKRAILASWASDIFAIESNPVLRLYPGADKAVPYDEILQALMTLDLGDERIGKHGLSNLVDRHKRSKR